MSLLTRCVQGSDDPFTIVPSVMRRALSGSVVEVTDRDVILERTIDAPWIEDGIINVEQQLLGARRFATPTAGAVINEGGTVTVDAAKTVDVFASVGQVTRRVAVTLASGAAATVDRVDRFVTGSLGAHCSNAIDALIAGKTAETLPIFTTQNHDTPNYVRNPDFWGASIAQKLTCVSPYNTFRGTAGSGTAITPRHLLTAMHIFTQNGTVFRFVTPDNQVVERTQIAAAYPAPGWSFSPPGGQDIWVILLDSDLPESIVPCKTLPEDVRDHVGSSPGLVGYYFNSKGIPCLCLDQNELGTIAEWKLGVERFGLDPSNASIFFVTVAMNKGTTAHRQLFYRDKIVGDSGNPAFLVVNGELVCVTTWTGGGPGSGISTAQPAVLNETIGLADAAAGVNTGYTVTPADLSGFPTYV